MRSRRLGWVLALVAGAVSLWAWPRLPPMVELPWGRPPQSVVPRLRAVLVAPALILGVWALIQLFPKVDPRGEEAYERFASTYLLLANLLLVFVMASHAVVLASSAAGTPVPEGLLIAAAGVLVAVIGNYLGRIEPNWFIGIRTPWTLASDVVWRRTHRVVGRILFGAGLLLALVGPFLSVRPGVVVGGTAALVAVASMLVSFMIWRSEGAPRDRRG